MRVIEKQMLSAIMNMTDFNMGNTIIKHHKGTAAIYLNNNHIADFYNHSNKLIVDICTLRNWPTNTTKSRLRALGVNVTTKKGVTYLDNQPIN